MQEIRNLCDFLPMNMSTEISNKNKFTTNSALDLQISFLHAWSLWNSSNA